MANAERDPRASARSAAFLLLMLLIGTVLAWAAPDPAAPMTPSALDDLVAPVALDPDPLLGELLAAATYPMEIAEADQWVRDHASWKPSKLMDKAKKQKWDPSVQGLVAFPDVLQQLAQNMTWTTQLGNAFLAQQADVMAAVQRMRAQAMAKGTLRTTPQETVTSSDLNGQTEISIEPADPNVWYVPDYNPAYVWGPPIWGAYPDLMYPGIDAGFAWYPGIDLGLCFGGWGGWGWGGWGWTPDWYAGAIVTDHSFFHRFGFRANWGEAGALGRSTWVHDPMHRMGVPYANREVATRFLANPAIRGGASMNLRARPAAPAQHFGTPQFEQRAWTNNHSVFGGYHDGAMTRMQSDHGFASMGAVRASGGGMRMGGAMPMARPMGGGMRAAPAGGMRGGGGRR
ncbi:MAG TPA: DUF3300 domain-containing protein [Bryobacteraceae bacterium]|nr:DUF3300 domain-containing protein [Bryobacteraceae bacterium]